MIMRTYDIIDLSHPLSSQTPVYPGDAGVTIEVTDEAQEPFPGGERRLNNSRIALGLHNGTHIDAPFHFFSHRATIDSIPIASCVGPAVWIDLSKTTHAGVIDADDLLPWQQKCIPFKKLLISTGWDVNWGKARYFADHPEISLSAAETIVSWGITLVGVDFPSVDKPPFEAHQTLLSKDVLIVENLRGISTIGDRSFDFFSVPLAIGDRDASPVRAFAICEQIELGDQL